MNTGDQVEPGPTGVRVRNGGRVLSDEEDLAAAIVETVPTPLLVLDADLRVHRANRAWYRAFGMSGSRAAGRYLFDLDDGAWDTEELRTGLEEILPRDREIQDLSVRYERPDGQVRNLRLNARHVEDGTADMELILVSVEDTTEFHRYEEQIERYARELERSNRDLESFAHAASHDLQEPLRKIRTYADRISASLDPATLDERLSRYLERLPEAVSRMQRRIDDLLLYARIGRSGTEVEPVDLAEVIGAIRHDLDTAISESGAEVDVGDLPTVLGDASQLQLLFQNLVANAIKFAREGGAPRIRIHSVPGTPAGSPLPDERTATVVVEDEGIGFEEEYAERIFLPFHRLHGRSEYQGSGVGLAICRRIAEEHGGRITADGRPGEGATFRIELPLASSPEGAA